jgi:DNA-binding IclR family transcriptional regulator
VRLVAEARRETPEATLAELAERLDLHRSAVQRALERIERLAASPPDGETPSRHHPARNPSPEPAPLA